MENLSIEPKQKSTPKDVFLHLLVIVALYASIISIITLIFQYIHYAFPDTLSDYLTSILDSIRWSSSVLFISFPIYILISWFIIKDQVINPQKRELKIRKWLWYLTLFITAITMAGDLITLVYYFYGGDLTTRFVLKVLTVLIVSCAVFGYYLWDLKKDQLPTARIKYFAIISAIVVLVSIISGFFIVGSPAKQRALKFDQQRISDLQVIQNQIIYYWTQKQKLPIKLADLTDSISGFTAPKDPETGDEYKYGFESELKFLLCANFKTASGALKSDEQFSIPRAIPTMYYPSNDANWSHPNSQYCFTRTIDPQLYKTNNQPPIK